MSHDPHDDEKSYIPQQEGDWFQRAVVQALRETLGQMSLNGTPMTLMGNDIFAPQRVTTSQIAPLVTFKGVNTEDTTSNTDPITHSTSRADPGRGTPVPVPPPTVFRHHHTTHHEPPQTLQWPEQAKPPPKPEKPDPQKTPTPTPTPPQPDNPPEPQSLMSTGPITVIGVVNGVAYYLYIAGQQGAPIFP